jgi:hypothetical protein
MSYSQSVKWSKRHPKGTRQPVLMHTGSGFWPSRAFLELDFWPYLERCKQLSVKPIDCKEYYDAQVKGEEVQP